MLNQLHTEAIRSVVAAAMGAVFLFLPAPPLAAQEAPDPPQNVRATAVAGGIRLDWDAPADNAVQTATYQPGQFPFVYALRFREVSEPAATYRTDDYYTFDTTSTTQN